MKPSIRLSLAFLLMAPCVRAQRYINDVTDLTGRVFSAQAVVPFYYDVGLVQGSTPIDLTDRRVTMFVNDQASGYPVTSFTGLIVNATEGRVTFPFQRINAGTYTATAQVTRVDNGEHIWPAAADVITFTNPPSASGGGSVNVSVTTTANVLVASSGTGNVVTGITANGSTVTEHRGTVAGGGGDAPVINGERPTNLTFNASYPFTVSTVTNADGMTITYGLSGNSGTIIVPAAGTSTSELYYVSTNAQFYTAGATATQLLFFGIGAAAGTSPGGFGWRFVACTGSQVFACYIPQGGLTVTNGTAQGGWGYGRGGSATSTNGQTASSGGGALAVLTGTNLIFGIGGAGGNANAATRSPGGGLVGGYVSASSAGGPGTQTNAGAAATATAGATAGSGYDGGNGTAAGGANPGSGGGAGFYPGGGACGSASTLNNSGGGGASLVFDGYTDRSPVDTASPPGTSSPQYRSPYGVGLSSATNSARANSGFLSITAFPAP